MKLTPCAADPELFFGAHVERRSKGGPSPEELDRAAFLSKAARTKCIRECPLAQQRECARNALNNGEAWGVWAGVQLPGSQHRKVPQLEKARKVLQGIADGVIDPRTDPINCDLRTEHGTQLTLLTPQVGPAGPRRIVPGGHASTAVPA